MIADVSSPSPAPAPPPTANATSARAQILSTTTTVSPFQVSAYSRLNGAPPPPSPSGVPMLMASGMKTGTMAGISGGCVAAVFVLILLFVFCKKKMKMKKKNNRNAESEVCDRKAACRHEIQQCSDFVVTIQPKPLLPRSAPQPISNGGSGLSTPSSKAPFLMPSPTISLLTTRTFTYKELKSATDGFSDANLLGEGGFGYVHKGVLPNGTQVAVKQLKAGSGQGEREFQAEVEIISRVQHKHLVSLVGYCLTGSWRMLVYEFVPNNNLEFHLYGKGRPVMDWSTRLKIALGAAKGLAYLHEECNLKIIHRDIKASNILLDLDFEAKVADFGLAKLFNAEETHVSTRVMGTFGYLAPEYALSGKLTEKSDVFSFGVLLLQLITGRPPFNKNKGFNTECLVDWARPLLTQALDLGNFDALVDPRIHNDYNRKEVVRMMACSAACVFHSAKQRPKMSQVVMALEGHTSILFDTGKEMGRQGSKVYSPFITSSEYNTVQYNEDIKKFQKMVLESGEQYSSSTGERGMSREMETGKITTQGH